MKRLSALLRCSGLLPAAVLVGACATTGGGPPQASEGAAALYEQGRYEAAYEQAVREFERARPRDQDEPRLLAGLSAFGVYEAHGRAEDLDRSESWLQPLASHEDDGVAGRAGATLGLIAAARRNDSIAAAFLSDAATKLDGDDAARAHLHAGLAYQSMGQVDAARRSFALARATASDPSLTAALGQRATARTWTVQLGAFASRANADRLAAEAAGRADARGLGEARVVGRSEPGRTLYLVHVGRFESKREAQRALIALSMGGLATLAEPGT